MSSPSLTSPHVHNCTRCAELEQRLETAQLSAELDVVSLGVQLARAQREIDRLKGDLSERAKEITKRDRELYNEWLAVHGKDPELKTNAFGPAAQGALTRARRAGLEQDDMLKVVRSHGKYRFLVFGQWAASGSARDKKDKLSDAFKNEDRWGALLELADAPIPLPSPRSQKPEHFISHGYSRPIDNLVTALERNDLKPYLSGAGQGTALCPVHDDRQKSFRFKEADNGSVLMYCQACSSHFLTGEAFCDQVRETLELPLSDLYPNRKVA